MKKFEKKKKTETINETKRNEYREENDFLEEERKKNRAV